MKTSTILSFLAAVITLAASVLVYLEYIYLLGFPDGFITELEAVQRILAYIFIAVSTVFALIFVYLGWTGMRKTINQKLAVAGVLYLLIAVGLAAADYYFSSQLANSSIG